MSRTTGNVEGCCAVLRTPLKPVTSERGEDSSLSSQAQLLMYTHQWGLGCVSDTGREEQGAPWE